MTFNSDGTCHFCWVDGCRFCNKENAQVLFTCNTCWDSTATIDADGKCVCPAGKHMINNQCQDCPVALTNGQCILCDIDNCETCQNDVCTECIDPQFAVETEAGTCACRYDFHDFNEHGYCAQCLAAHCKHCKSDSFVSSTCAECLDPTATPQNGVCTCPDGQAMQDDGYCGGCPEGQIIVDGVCRVDCGDNLGCKTCQNGVCTQCIDSTRAVLSDNQCICKFTGSSLRKDGTCGYCWVPGCTFCTYQSLISFTCVQCHSSATLENGKCTCPTGQYIVDGICQNCPYTVIDGQCRQCALDNCLQCSDPSICTSCIDRQFAEIVDGQCSCRFSDDSFNIKGYCSKCRAIGCEVCQADAYTSTRCAKCIDPDATLQDGVCTCPDGQAMQDDGLCYPCNAFGCEACAKDDPEFCQKCVGFPTAIPNDDGQCECIGYSSNIKLNSEGKCQQCYKQGCKYCIASYNSCYTCIDEQNTSINGSGDCVCDGGLSFNDDWYCQECDVPGCASCITGQSSVCGRCESGYFLEDGKCECNSLDQKVNQNGVCSACSVLGCSFCLSNDASQCRSCYDGAELIDNGCYCEKSGEAPNEKGKCSACFVAGCLSCSSQNPYQCLSCSANFNLQSGICSCANSGQKINLVGECEACNVEGCQSCETGNPNACAKCFDCDAFLIGGQCSCPDQQIWSPSLNQCSQQAIANKLSGSLRSKKECPENCDACEDGQCSQCQEGFYLKQFDNKCMRCNPRCGSCIDGLSCEVHREGWTTFRGKIKHCDVLHCADCSEHISKCQRCKDHYTLANEYTCEVSGDGAVEYNGNFTQFKEKYNKSYSSPQEEKLREEIYYHNYEQMIDLSKVMPYEMGENHLMDQTEEERNHMTGYKPTQERLKSSRRQSIPILGNAPASLNWTERGVITSVKNQGNCGACWAFGAAAGAESSLIQMNKATIDIDLSEQYFTDCTANSGCEGTYDVNQVMSLSLSGVPLESAFPYTAIQNSYAGICEATEKVFISSSYKEYEGLTDDEIITLLQDGPLVCTLSASDWSYYKGGIFACSLQAEVNHVVQLVGYTEDYWLIKNQWGDYWGEQGYMRVTRNRDYSCFIGLQFFRHDMTICEVPGCIECSADVSACTGCHVSATLKDGACECNQAGHVFESSGNCVPCEVFGCQECQISNSQECKTCHGTMVLVDGQCTCPPDHKYTKEQTCVLCQVDGCQFCEEGKTNVCTKCADCSAFLDEGTCHCQEGYQMNDQGICLRKNCTDPFIFESGICRCPQFYFQIGGTCSQCVNHGCKQCQNDGEGNAECQSCYPGKVLLAGKCVSCPTGQYEAGGSCVACSIESCVACSSASVCTQCESGKVLNANQDGCVSCPTGFYQNDGICDSCNPLCLTCSSRNICTSCPSSSHLVGPVCLSCLSGCAQCSPFFPLLCSRCQSNHFLLRYFCFECPTGCSACSSFTQCSSCHSPYQLSGNECVLPCTHPCLTCQQDDPTSCLSCSEGYSPSGSTCLENLSCNETSTCTECPAEYFLSDSGTCQSCTSNCKFCSESACTQCMEGYDLFKDKCYDEHSFTCGGNRLLCKMIRRSKKLLRKFQQIIKR